MANPVLGYQLAQQGINLAAPANATTPTVTSAASGGAPIGGATRLFYPLQRIEATSDYLEIKILQYCAAGLGLAPAAGAAPGSFALGTASANVNQQRPLAYIHLPIPQNLSDTQGIDWGEDRMGPLAAAAAQLAGNLVEGDIEGAAQGAVDKVVSGINDPSTRKVVQAALASKGAKLIGANIDPNSFLARATGQVLNPNLELLFKGPTLRTFSFSFDFAPRDAGEGQMVKKIIWTLKKHMVAKQNASGLIIGTPDIFQLQYKTGSRPHAFLNSFKPAALINMDVNYTGSGTYATYTDATPVHITVLLQFRELNPIYFEEYKDSDTNVGY